jgi:hypothetical protein
MNIDKSGYWKPHVINSSALSVPKTSKAVAARKKEIDVSIDSLIT